MLTLFNVGQGDAFLIKPNCSCKFDGVDGPLLVDTGARNEKVADRISDACLRGTWSIHSKCQDVNRLCLKMGRKSALKAAFAI